MSKKGAPVAPANLRPQSAQLQPAQAKPAALKPGPQAQVAAIASAKVVRPPSALPANAAIKAPAPVAAIQAPVKSVALLPAKPPAPLAPLQQNPRAASAAVSAQPAPLVSQAAVVLPAANDAAVNAAAAVALVEQKYDADEKDEAKVEELLPHHGLFFLGDFLSLFKYEEYSNSF